MRAITGMIDRVARGVVRHAPIACAIPLGIAIFGFGLLYPVSGMSTCLTRRAE